VSDQEIIFERTIPILRMFDVAKAREFYLDYLGFEVEFEHRFDVEAPLFMGVSRGGVWIFLSEHYGDGTPGTHVIIRVSGIEALHRELVVKKYRYFNPSIQTQEWGTREMVVYDPFNNHLVFSERIDTKVLS
jgi:catechol 2,3-dioxygenase-like lactoylglutathione lyase family enzyme